LTIENLEGRSDCGSFKVLAFQSAEELLASELPAGNACLSLHVWMQGMSGIELCRNIATSGRHFPTILTSGLDDEHTRQIMREVEPIASLFKPFDEKQLVRAIRKALRRKHVSTTHTLAPS
jgi:FixJ family two-component response regulator